MRTIQLDSKNLTIMIPEILTKIEVLPARMHGLEVYRVVVNGTELAQFMSQGQANAKAKQFAQKLAQAA